MNVNNMSKEELQRVYDDLDDIIHEESQINVPSHYKYVQDINRFKLKYPDHNIERSVGYLFFTKPDLNILDDSGEVLDQAAGLYSIRDMLRSKDIALVQSLKSNYGPKFINLLASYAENLDLPDQQMKPRESAETSSRWKIMYGFRTSESKAANTFSITYTDDRNLSVYKTHKVWVDYIDAVSVRCDISPKREYVLKRILDYAVSVYYILVSEDGKSVLYFGKFVGVFPLNTSDSAFSWSKGDEGKVRSYQIQYQYSFFLPMNPLLIKEFNDLNGSIEGMKVCDIYDAQTGLMGPTWAKKVKMVEKKENGNFSGYSLEFYR